jgi:hypothetical protein
MALTDFMFKAPIVEQIAEYLWKWLNQDRELRLLQAQNAPAIAAESNATVTDAAAFSIPNTDNMQILYSTLIVATDEASGKGRYLTSGRRPSALGQGAPLPSGGAIVKVRGNEQIRKFQLIGETGQTLNVWWALYQ